VVTVVLVLSVLITLTGCSSTRTKWMTGTKYPPLNPPSDCTIEWVFDTARDQYVPDCVVKDLVEKKQAAEYIDIVKDDSLDISKWSVDWKKLGLGLVVGGVAAMVGSYIGPIVSVITKLF